ncbi:MAG TPA: LPS export ABC transporter periplasmic protein LptC [Pyrinomonadaceae bacterium]|nr:LPS export ABC transporter periplasmic protein LptC [Pyrinomonadaceae bacterium]
MAENIQRKNVKNLRLRARMPQIFRALAVCALAATILGIGVGFYRSRNNKEFRMKGMPTELSKDVVAEVNGYERREADGDVIKYYLKADKATTYTDNHQELENVFLQVFDEAGDKFDKITASKAIYIPTKDDTKNFNAYFSGNVDIETRDALKVKTRQLSYDKATETAEAEEAVEFSRNNISGKSTGAVVKIKQQRLELRKDVEITAFESPELANSNVQFAKISAGNGVVDQTAERIEFAQNVKINVTPTDSGTMSPTDIQAQHATAIFNDKQIRKIDLAGSVEIYQKATKNNTKWTKTRANRAVANIDREVKRFELFENVDIETAQNNDKPTKIKTGYALYEKDADKFELKNGVEIVTVEDDVPTTIRARDAVYEQSNGKIFLDGAAEIAQGNDFLKGDNLTAELFPNKKLKSGFARGNAYLKQTTPERTTEVSANELNAFFGDNQQLQNANAAGEANAVLTPANSREYAKVTLSAVNAVKLNFQTSGLLRQMQTDGRTTILMNAPADNPNASNKKLTADKVVTVMNASGRDFERAEAAGNAELFVEPIQPAPENYKTTINAARFDCAFFETGNNAKNCAAQGKTKTVRVPTIAGANRGTQTISADRLNADFSRQTQDVERFEAFGGAKFTERDRNAIADGFNFTASDGTLRLRGGEPTIWDAQARAKAVEIDWDTRNEKSFLRGKVSTTYYSQKQTNGATPFGDTGAPVFITAADAEFNHRAETALYTGNARAWQENNYVRADRLLIKQKDGQLLGDGAVQSLLYNAKRRENGRETNVPAFAAAQKMVYSRNNNSLRYEGAVDIRQGTDRIVAGAATVLMNDKNEVAQTVAENNVVVTQPKRRASGDYAQYTAENEVVILRGNPARIEDSENGSSQSAQVTVYLRENRFVGESKTPQTNTGRIRSVYKIKKQ